MPDWLTVFLLTWMAGLTMPLGGLIAKFENIRPLWLEHEFRHSVIAFGGGALLSAVALVLIPEGTENLDVSSVSILFLLGGATFLGLDILLDRFKSPAGQLVAMLSDFIPEALSLGAAFALGSPTGVLLALMIAVQNLPEGFNAYRELKEEGHKSPRWILTAFLSLSILGPVSGLTGFYWLVHYPSLVSQIMVFASGGILYLVFQDIAPQAKLERKWAPAFGAVLGFLLGLMGKMLVE